MNAEAFRELVEAGTEEMMPLVETADQRKKAQSDAAETVRNTAASLQQAALDYTWSGMAKQDRSGFADQLAANAWILMECASLLHAVNRSEKSADAESA